MEPLLRFENVSKHYVISNSLQGYDYGTAGVAILLVFLVAYCIERVFVRIKKKFY